jgi:hypothetical protein
MLPKQTMVLRGPHLYGDTIRAGSIWFKMSMASISIVVITNRLGKEEEYLGRLLEEKLEMV